jgi:hypothetical protein
MFVFIQGVPMNPVKLFSLTSAALVMSVSAKTAFAGATYLEIPAMRATYGVANIEDKSRAGEDKSYKLDSNGLQTLPSRLTFVARSDQFELQLSRFLESPTGYLGLGYFFSDHLLVAGLGLNGTYGTVNSLTAENKQYKQNLRSFSVGPYVRKFIRFDSGEIEIRAEVNFIRDFSQSDEPTKLNPNANLIYTRQASGYESDLDFKYWASVYKGVHLGTGLNVYYKSIVDKYGAEYSLEGSIRSDFVIGLNLLNARVYF